MRILSGPRSARDCRTQLLTFYKAKGSQRSVARNNMASSRLGSANKGGQPQLQRRHHNNRNSRYTSNQTAKEASALLFRCIVSRCYWPGSAFFAGSWRLSVPVSDPESAMSAKFAHVGQPPICQNALQLRGKQPFAHFMRSTLLVRSRVECSEVLNQGSE